MTERQKKKIKAIIRKDSKIMDEYYFNGDTCVIGGLLMAAGVLPDRLKQIENRAIHWCDEECKVLRATYGITNNQARAMQIINDKEVIIEKRRAALIKYINGKKSPRKPAR